MTALQERVLQGELKKVQDVWATQEFMLLEHKPEVSRDVYILAGTDEVVLALEESQVTRCCPQLFLRLDCPSNCILPSNLAGTPLTGGTFCMRSFPGRVVVTG